MSGAVGRMTVIASSGAPIVHKSLALNLAQTGIVQLVYSGISSRPGGASFELDKFDSDAFNDLILKFVEALIGEREQAQVRRRAEIAEEFKPAG